MTFEDDFVRLCMQSGFMDLNCVEYGISWPPPEQIVFEGFAFARLGYSSITDEQRSKVTHVCRGAEYYVDPDQSEAPAPPPVLC